MKDAVKAGETETVRLVLFEPEAFDTVNVTVLDPAVVKVWLGFLDAEVPPSPKFQDQEVGDPVDVSVNWMDCPAIGEAGSYPKEASSAVPTVIVRVEVLDPELFVTVRATVLVPAEVKTWLGCWEREVPPSPKFQVQEVGDPVDVSVNWMDCPAIGAVGL